MEIAGECCKKLRDDDDAMIPRHPSRREREREREREIETEMSVNNQNLIVSFSLSAHADSKNPPGDNVMGAGLMRVRAGGGISVP